MRPMIAARRLPNGRPVSGRWNRNWTDLGRSAPVNGPGAPSPNEAATPALFLAGKGRLTSEFTPSFIELPAALPAGSRALKLVPKSKQPDYDWLVLAVDPATLAIRGLGTIDAQGGASTFAFTNLKQNVGLVDNQFTFKIPRGVDVVTGPSRH